jgi:hypothetical protein
MITLQPAGLLGLACCAGDFWDQDADKPKAKFSLSDGCCSNATRPLAWERKKALHLKREIRPVLGRPSQILRRSIGNVTVTMA